MKVQHPYPHTAPSLVLHTMDTSEHVNYLNKYQVNEERRIELALLGLRKPTAGVVCSGDMKMLFKSEQSKFNPEEFYTSTDLQFSFFDVEGERIHCSYMIASIPDDAKQMVGWVTAVIEGALSINVGEVDKNLVSEFIYRLNTAILNPKYTHRFKVAANMARWGVL